MRVVRSALLSVGMFWVCSSSTAGGEAVAVPEYVFAARTTIQDRLNCSRSVSATTAGGDADVNRDSVQVLHWKVVARSESNRDSVIVLYCGVGDSAMVGVCRKRAPDSLIGITDIRFAKNSIFGGGVIRRAGDILHEGYLEIVINYFEGFQSEAARVFRLNSRGVLESIPRVRVDGSSQDHFGGWFGVMYEDLDGDSVPEFTEHTYLRHKFERIAITYRWNGSVFQEWKRE